MAQTEPKKGLLIIAHPAGGDAPAPLGSPDDDMPAGEPDADDDKADLPQDASCSTCYAYQPSTGYCRRFPPHGPEWSQVDPDDFCCEWQKGQQHDNAGGGNAPNSAPAPDQGIPQRGGSPQYSMS